MAYNLYLHNGVYWGYKPLILTFDPNFLGHPSGCFNTIQGKSLSTNLSWSFHPTYHYDPYDHDFISFCHQVSCTCQNSWPQRNTKKIHFGKLTWPWKTKPFEDVYPIKNGDCSIVMLNFLSGTWQILNLQMKGEDCSQKMPHYAVRGQSSP